MYNDKQQPVVIIHEPDPELALLYQRSLRRRPITVHFSQGHSQLWGAVRSVQAHVVIYSVSSWDKDQVAFVDQLARLQPSLRIIVLTEEMIDHAQHELGSGVAAHFVKKYSSPQDIGQAVIKLLNSYAYV